MLILRRKSGESIVISDNINVTVLDINEGSVRLAIDAPKEIPILRSELLQAADANRDSAVMERSPAPDLLRRLEGKRAPGHPVAPVRALRPSAFRPASATPGVPATPEQNAEPVPATPEQNAESVPVASAEAPDAPAPASPESQS